MWDVRGVGQSYYYQHRRVNGRPRRVYVGPAGSPHAQEARRHDDQRRAHRLAEQEARRQDESRWQQADDPLLHLAVGVVLLGHASLLVAGFYQHNGGEWRKRRA
jgi:hypothetical protein